MKKKEMKENEKRILTAVRRLRNAPGCEAEEFGEESRGAGVEWGDAVVQNRKGKLCASAFLEVDGGMGDVLPLFAGEEIPLCFFEAPSPKRISEMKERLKRKLSAASKALKSARKAKVSEKAEHWEDDLGKSERMLLQVEIAERLSFEPGCLRKYAVTTAVGGSREAVMERLRHNIKRILFRAGGRMLKEHEIRKCFKWEESLAESIESAEEKWR